jgi:hypothetical protein
MKQRVQLLARARYAVRSKAESIAAIQRALGTMLPFIGALNQQVGAEESRTRITDPKDPSYSTVARAARTRSHNLQKSAAALEERLVATTAEHERLRATLAALEDLKPVQFLQLPFSDGPAGEARRRRRLRTYSLRAVTVIAPSNDNTPGAPASLPLATTRSRAVAPLLS